MADSDDAIKARMDQRLDEVNWSLVDLAEATEESYRNVHRWIREDVKVPAHFITRFARAVPVNPEWLLTGEGSPDPVGESTAKKALERIARVLDSVRLTSSTGILAECVIDSSFDGVLAFDRDLRYTLWNPAMERITGVSQSALLGERIFDVFPRIRGTEVEEHLRAALSGEVLTTEERPYQIPEKARAGWFEARYSPLRDRSGEIVGGLCIFREVSRRREASVLLSEAEERYRTLSELSSEATFIQREGRVVEANPSLEGLVCRGESVELVGARVADLFSCANGGPEIPRVLDAVEVGERIGPLPARLSRQDGSSVGVEILAAGVHFHREPAAQALVRPRQA